MKRRDFERLVAEVLDSLPPEFQAALEHVAVVVEDWPTPEQLRSVGLDEDETLYGLYEGTPLIERGLDLPPLPDRIVIFRGPLLEDFATEEEIRAEIRTTVLHELAHFFGLDEDRIAELGYE